MLFLPSDAFFTAALEQEPGLIEEAFQQSVLIATPATLVALLKTVYYGWRQESLTENAQKIAVEARELYNRVRIFSEHIDSVGKGLEDAVKAHNNASSAFAWRVVPQAEESKSSAPRPRRSSPPRAPSPSGPRSSQRCQRRNRREREPRASRTAGGAELATTPSPTSPLLVFSLPCIRSPARGPVARFPWVLALRKRAPRPWSPRSSHPSSGSRL